MLNWGGGGCTSDEAGSSPRGWTHSHTQAQRGQARSPRNPRSQHPSHPLDLGAHMGSPDIRGSPTVCPTTPTALHPRLGPSQAPEALLGRQGPPSPLRRASPQNPTQVPLPTAPAGSPCPSLWGLALVRLPPPHAGPESFPFPHITDPHLLPGGLPGRGGLPQLKAKATGRGKGSGFPGWAWASVLGTGLQMCSLPAQPPHYPSLSLQPPMAQPGAPSHSQQPPLWPGSAPTPWGL